MQYIFNTDYGFNGKGWSKTIKKVKFASKNYANCGFPNRKTVKFLYFQTFFLHNQ